MESCSQTSHKQLLYNDNVVADIYPNRVEFHNQTIANIYKVGINVPDYKKNKWGEERITMNNPLFPSAMVRVEFKHSLKSQGYILREVKHLQDLKIV
jgi:hypothetical protein